MSTMEELLHTADESTTPPVVLIVHASVGSGHKMAAEAIALEFEARRGDGTVPPNLQVEVVDILEFGRISFNGDNWASLFTGATRPVYDLTWRFLFTGRLLWGGGWSWSRIMFPKYTEYIRQKNPLAVIATHITGANATVGARMITKQNFPIVCVATDYETEGWWPHRAADLICVGTEYMAETLRARKVEEQRIAITGIPTRPDFSQDFDRLAIRQRFELPLDKTIVLALAGASMPAPYALFRETLDKSLPYLHTLHNTHVVIVAGTDKEYSSLLRKKTKELGLSNITILEYVNDIAALLACADVAICKPGGLVVTECLCTRTPMIILGRAYGQEFVNMRMLTYRGAAMHVTTPRELMETLRQLDEHPRSIESLLINGAVLRKPHAAADIVSRTMNLATGETPCDPATRKHYFAHFYWGKKPAHIR